MSILITALILLTLVSAWVFYFSFKRRETHVKITPEDYGLAKEDASFMTADNIPLHGWFIPREGSGKTLILMHGFGMNKVQVLKYTHQLAREYNLFYFDFRGAGESGGKTGQGLLEDKDIAAAVQYLKTAKKDAAREIALYGISLGAAAAAHYASVDHSIKCIVLESVFYSYKDVAARWTRSHLRIPYFPVVYLFLRFKSKKHKIGLEDFAPQTIAANIKCPVLMIHAELDRLAPLPMAKETFNLLQTKKEMWMVNGAAHSNIAEKTGQEYTDKISVFLKENF